MTNTTAANFEKSSPTEDSIVLKPALEMTVSPENWETLCTWLTNELHGVAGSVERRAGSSSRLENHFHPVESFLARLSTNNVRIIAITVRTNGHTRTFEIAGPTSVTLKRNPAGRPTMLEIRGAEDAIVLHFCGPIPTPFPAASANSWGE